MSQRHEVSYQGPLYEQVHRVLRSRILAGEWEPREPLPGEAWLSRELGVSIGTVRKAMDQLTRENIVFRERGRGTFVRRNAEWRSNSAFRLCDSDGQPIATEIRMAGSRTGPATAKEAADLKLMPRQRGTATVLRLDREWTGKQGLLCRETIVVEESRFPGLAERMDAGAETLFATYAEHYRSVVDRVQWAIGGPAIEQGQLTAQKEAAGDASLHLRRIAVDGRGMPLEICEQRIMVASCLVQISR